jgi:hypothetical protein
MQVTSNTEDMCSRVRCVSNGVCCRGKCYARNTRPVENDIPGGPGNKACMAQPNTFLCAERVCRPVCPNGYAPGVVPVLTQTVPGGVGNAKCARTPNTFLCMDQVCRPLCTAGYAAGVVPPVPSIVGQPVDNDRNGIDDNTGLVITTLTNPNQMQNGNQPLPALPSSCSASADSDGTCARVCQNDGVCCSGGCYARPAKSASAFPLIPVIVAGSVVLVILIAALAYCKSQQRGIHQGGSRALNDYDGWASNPSLTRSTQNAYHL